LQENEENFFNLNKQNYGETRYLNSNFIGKIDYDNNKQTYKCQFSNCTNRYKDLTKWQYPRHLIEKHLCTDEQVSDLLKIVNSELLINKSIDPDKILNKIDDIEIRNKDLESLYFNEPTNKYNLINDVIINSYLKIIQANIKNILIVSSYCCDSLFKPITIERKRATNWFGKTDIFKYDLLIFPICNDKHWTLIVVDLNDCKIKYFDSYYKIFDKSLNKRYESYIKSLILNEAVKANHQINIDGLQYIDSPSDLPQQNNDTDCGLFLCNFVNVICTKGNLVKIKDSWIDREQIKSALLNYATGTIL
jgi:Ulp1 family protease